MKNTNGYQFSYNMNVDELRKLLFEHVTRNDNPHKVSPADIGLGNVDNTADKDKPLSDVGKAYIDKLYVTGIKMVRAEQTETKLNKGGKESQEYTIGEVTVSLLNGNGDAVSSDKILIDNVAHDFQGRAFISDYANNLEITNKGDIRLLSPDGTILSQGSFPPAIENVTFEIENNKCELVFHFYGGTTLKCSLNTLLEYLKSDYVSKAEFVEFKDDVKIKFATTKEDIDNLRKQVAQGFTDLDKIIKELRTDLTNKIVSLAEKTQNKINRLNNKIDDNLRTVRHELENTAELIRSELKTEVATLNGTITSKVTELKDIINVTKEGLQNEISRNVAQLNDAIDDLEDDLRALIANVNNTLDNKIDGIKNTLDSKIDSVKNTLDDRIDSEVNILKQADELLDSKITALGKKEASDIDELLVKYKEVKEAIDATEGKLVNKIDNLSDVIDLKIADVKSTITQEVEKLDTSISAVKAEAKTYTDSKVVDVKDELLKNINDTKSIIENKIEQAKIDLTTKINVDINDLRDELHSEIEHVEQDANIHLNQAKAELLETIDSAKADMNVEVSKAAHNLTMTANEQLFEYTFTLLDKKGNSLSTFTINLPIESVVVKAEYLAGTKEIQLTLQNGNTVKFSVADLVTGLAKQIDLQTEINDRIQNIQAVRDEIAAIKVELNKFVDEKDLARVAFTGSYNDLADKPDNIGRVADVVVNGDSVLNPVTKVAQIQLKTINGEAISGNGDIKVKQDPITLKTINGQSLFGEGNIQIDPETVHIKTINGKSIVGDGDVTDLYAAQDGINLTQGIFTIDFSKVASQDDIKNFVTLTTVNNLIKNFITADDVDTKLLPYAKLNDIPTVNYPVIDIKVDGESVVTDKVAEINLPKEFNLTPNSIVEVSETEKHTFDNYINTKAQALIDLNHLDNDEVEALMQELGI